MNRREWIKLGGLGSAAVLLGDAPARGFMLTQKPGAKVRVELQERLGPLEIDRIALGQGGQSEEPTWADRVAEIRALRPRLIRFFIQEYFDLLPAPGQYHFETLDRALDPILKTGAKLVMSINFKPSVLYPVVDHDVVEPNDWEQWESLVSRLVAHCKDRGPGFRYWEVANEPDLGESGGCPYRFKPDNYPPYYKHTVAAILRADPAALVGGPAVANSRSPILPAFLEFCDSQKMPLHFVSWHIYNNDPNRVRQTIDLVKEMLAKHPSLKPETMLNEWNMSLSNPPRDPRFQPCYVLETAWQMKDAGLDYSCYYHIRDYQVDRDRFARFFSPRGASFMARWWNRMPQYSALFDYQNNVRPAYFAFKLLARLTGERVRLESDQATVRGFATWDETYQLYNILIWNFSDTEVQVEMSIRGVPKKMKAIPFKLDSMAASNDENVRLRPEKPLELAQGDVSVGGLLEPWGVSFWSVEMP
jgi:xylan 1,4-beta-xylosidase